ncbi:hypothetical protein [Luteimonas terrae]|uniref:GIY-YIG nuclease family protein n=1 Tax=Luteimonas terrae TaxID=1530191 RepID=A0ABU1XVA5_9GAMM|nr:hypothetical protein [Luteimonas terrae]MDR7192011.1 hypothetical protein [Luteimonas terrae]
MKKSFESQLVEYLVTNYFDGGRAEFAEHTGYYKVQVDNWIGGKNKPQKATVRHLLSSCIAPEFRVAAEFKHVDIDLASQIRPELKKALGDHTVSSGVYAFYDSMCSVVYIGKASSGFLEEMYQQLKGPLGVSLPKRVRKTPFKRWEVVRYISAYEVPFVDHLDYPKHVEALVLRLSKPIGNKILGSLNKSNPPKDHGTARKI